MLQRMLSKYSFHYRRLVVIATLLGLFFFTTLFLAPPAAPEFISAPFSSWGCQQCANSSLHEPTSPEPIPEPQHAEVPPENAGQGSGDKHAVLPLPHDYSNLDFQDDQPEFCKERFTSRYLLKLRDHAVSYCSDGSRSNVTCFHSQTAEDGRVDSMCLGRRAIIGAEPGNFSMQCEVRQLMEDEKSRGSPPLDILHGYWYETGPYFIFKEFIRLDAPFGASSNVHARERRSDPPPRFTVLVKREGSSNIWHLMMEMSSLMLTFDVLQMAKDPLNGSSPYFRTPEDVADTQIVILDDQPDGPLFDLLKMFSGREPLRIGEFIRRHRQLSTDIIIPLAGGGNPLWQNDWEPHDCTTATVFRTFTQRVLKFYGAHDVKPVTPQDKEHIIVTYIDRKGSRRLQNHTGLLAELEQKYTHVRVQAVDFASLSFADQLRVARNTDVLVGVHGAGLTLAMFLREKQAAIVEIQPADLFHMGFRNIATMMGLGYYKVHAAMVAKPEDGNVEGRGLQEETRFGKRDAWHWADFELEKDRFMALMDAAIKSVYNKGSRSYDID